MSRSLSLALAIGTAFLLYLPALAQQPAAERRLALGRDALAEEIAAWDIDVRPDGLGLPAGAGSVKQGEKIYLQQCTACHGEFGEGAGRWAAIAGGRGSLTDHNPGKTIGSYWPYLSTVFDYVRRAMPFGNAQSMTADEVYAVTAFLLFMNDIVKEDFILSRENFAAVRLPNAGGFYSDDRETSERRFWSHEPCMSNCKPEVKVMNRARVLDVTPEEQKGMNRVD
ncbi:MAG: c-type cytochrome [Rhodospirillales bacterium]